MNIQKLRLVLRKQYIVFINFNATSEIPLELDRLLEYAIQFVSLLYC